MCCQCFMLKGGTWCEQYLILYYFCLLSNVCFIHFNISDRETIFFHSHDVSKPDSTSSLSILDPSDRIVPTPRPDPLKVQRIVCALRKEIGMSLLGIDIIIENGSGRYGIIDINEYPGDAQCSYVSASSHNFITFSPSSP